MKNYKCICRAGAETVATFHIPSDSFMKVLTFCLFYCNVVPYTNLSISEDE